MTIFTFEKQTWAWIRYILLRIYNTKRISVNLMNFHDFGLPLFTYEVTSTVTGAHPVTNTNMSSVVSET